MGEGNGDFLLTDDSRVGVIGGGPAGSFFSHFLLIFAKRADIRIQVDIYEPKNFGTSGPTGCNFCGGIISESLVQALAVEGIDLPPTVVQRGIEAYVMHTDRGVCRLDTPLAEKRIAAVHRGGGPRNSQPGTWESFDAHLLRLAIGEGANIYRSRVTGVRWNAGRPQLETKGQEPQTYDLVAGAVGVNSADVKLFEDLGFNYKRPGSTKTFITELPFGVEGVRRYFGDAMHVFLLDIPRLKFAALIPKGEYVTMCLLGNSIDNDLIRRFFGHPAVQKLFPAGWTPPNDSCRCSPRMFLKDAEHPFTDRLVLLGDSGVARLYKDGIGAAYRTAKAAARTAVFHGVSGEDFRKHYWPECRAISRDNAFGRVVFLAVDAMKMLKFPCDAVVRVAAGEQARDASRRHLSGVLWDTFTGSAPYRNVFLRCLRPSLMASLGVHSALSAAARLRRREPAGASAAAADG